MSVVEHFEKYTTFPLHLEYFQLDHVEHASKGCNAAILTGIYKDTRSNELRLVTGLVKDQWWSFPIPQELHMSPR